MSFKKLINSILNALRGFRYVFVHEQNFRIQLFVAATVVVFMFLLHVSSLEKLILLLVIILVLVLETVNTAMEKYIDIMEPRLGYHVGVVKDIMAAMVFVSAIGACIIGGVIFIPYLIDFFYSK